MLRRCLAVAAAPLLLFVRDDNNDAEEDADDDDDDGDTEDVENPSNSRSSDGGVTIGSTPEPSGDAWSAASGEKLDETARPGVAGEGEARETGVPKGELRAEAPAAAPPLPGDAKEFGTDAAAAPTAAGAPLMVERGRPGTVETNAVGGGASSAAS